MLGMAKGINVRFAMLYGLAIGSVTWLVSAFSRRAGVK